MTIDEALQQIAEENPELREIIEEANRLAEEMIAEDELTAKKYYESLAVRKL